MVSRYLHALLLGGLSLLIPATTHAFVGVLYFRDLRTGDRQNVVLAKPGDDIICSLDYSAALDERWDELAGFMNIGGGSAMTDTVATGITSYINTYWGNTPPYTIFTYGPGVVYNDKSHPNNGAKAKLSDDAFYFRFNIANPTGTQLSKSGIDRIFQFTIPTTAQPGTYIHWDRVNAGGLNDVATHIDVNFQDPWELTVNQIQIVPEPSAWVGLAFGVAALLGLRMRTR